MTTYAPAAHRGGSQPRWQVLLVAATIVPFYFELAGPSSNAAAFVLRPVRELAQPIHIASLVPLVAMAATTLDKKSAFPVTARHLDRRVRHLMLCFGVMTSIAVFQALIFRPSDSAPDRYVQTAVVLAPLFFAPKLRVDHQRLQTWILTASFSSIAMIEIYALVRFGARTVDPITRFEFAMAFPQLLVYLPFLAIIALTAALAFKDAARILRIATAIVAALFYMIMWSRTAVLITLPAMYSIAASSPNARRGVSKMVRRAKVHSAGMRKLGAMLVALLVIPTISFIGAGGSRLQNGSLTRTGRAETAAESLARLAESPMLGQGYIARSATESKPHDTHNQYLEFAMRGGLIGGTAMTLAVLLLAVALRRATTQEDEVSSLRRMTSAVYIAALVGGMSNVYLTQAFPGIFIWLLVGLSLARAGPRTTRQWLQR